ncbi:MAG TPA: F0F1 ATP synthase subunit delta [Acidimicrobiales bacterium]|nr:F0F1 ATP synthase subunit delta [Acidimicrobiales bacterium]
MRERVRGYADAIFEASGAHVGRVADELQDFYQLLAGSTDLAWAMANTVTPVPTKRAIIQQLLGRKLSAPVLDLANFVLQSSPAEEFMADVASLAAAAAARRDGMVLLDEGPLGRTGATERIDGYASAVLTSVRGERQLGDIEDELFRFMRIVEGNEELRVALTTAEQAATVRASVVTGLLTRRASQESARMATYAARVGRPRDYPALLGALVDLVAKEANRRVADVRSAIEMTAPQRARLTAALTSFTGYPVDVRATADPQLLGGFVANIGDVVIDASLRHRLELAREALLEPGRTAGSGGAVGAAGGPTSRPGEPEEH